MDIFVKNLRYLASQRSESQQETAAKTGVSQPTLSRLMRGSILDPSVSIVRRLASHYGVSVDDLLSRDLERDPPATQDVRFDPETLSSALVAVKEAMAHESLPIADIWALPRVLIFAYELRATYPKAMSKDQYRMFDQSVRMMLKGEIGGRQGDLPGRAAEGSSGGDGTAQTAPKRGRAHGH